MRGVLIVTSTFPPTADTGVFRTVKFVKYLPAFGWRPIVLHVHPNRSRPRDDSLLEEIPRETVVGRVGGGILRPLASLAARLSGRPRLRGDWARFRNAARLGARLCAGQRVEVIYVSAPPDRLVELGLMLHDRTRLPLVLDFRDPPFGLNAAWNPPAPERAHSETLARTAFSKAARLIANTEVVRLEMLKTWDLPGGRVVTLPNGYDEADFAGAPASPDRAERSGRMQAVSIGAPRPGRELDAFAAALDLARRDPAFRSAFRLRILGRRYWFLRRALEGRGLLESIEFSGHLPHRQAMHATLASDLNIVFVPGKTSATRVAQKLYAYLRAGRPILAFQGRGPGWDLVETARLGRSVEPLDEDGMAAALLEAFRRWRLGKAPPPVPREWLERFERRRQTGVLADVLAGAAAGAARPPGPVVDK